MGLKTTSYSHSVFHKIALQVSFVILSNCDELLSSIIQRYSTSKDIHVFLL
jgi:hypothetical protein